MIKKATILFSFMFLLLALGNYSSAIDLKGFGEKLKKLGEGAQTQEPAKEESKEEPSVQETGTDEITETPPYETDENETMETTAPKSTEMIKPFGGIEWEDDFATVVKKISGFEGIEKVELQFNYDEPINIKGITDKDALAAKLSKALERSNTCNDEYVGINGEKRKMSFKRYSITAFPIIIGGSPFELTVAFEGVSGLELKNRDGVLAEKRMNCTFPLVLESVNLQSNSPAIKDSCEKIMPMLADKYNDKTLPENCKTGRGWSFSDDYGHTFNGRVSYSDLVFFMSYSGGTYIEELNEAYRKHLVELELKKTKGKKDMGSGL